MLQSKSHSKPKFLFDENVKKRLERFLKKQGHDCASAPKGIRDKELAALAKREQRILVTNDHDFADPELFPRESLFSVVLLTLPQDKPEELIKAFSLLLKERTSSASFAGHLIVVKMGFFEASLIPFSSSKKI